MEGATRDMERRLAEIKQLFEKEQIKSEKERLIWASAGDGKKQTKKKQLMADRQSRLILGKGLHNVNVLTGKEPLEPVKQRKNDNLNQFIEQQQQQLKQLKLGSRKKSQENFGRTPAPLKTPTPPPQQPAPTQQIEEYVLVSLRDDSEVFEVPLDASGNVPMGTIRAIVGAKCPGIYTLVQGRKRIIVADQNDIITRPRGGWTEKVFYPLEPPRRPDSARSSLAERTTPRSPMAQSDSLLAGTYDEEKESLAFQAAVMQFRAAAPPYREMNVQVNQAELRQAESGKLDEAVELFGDSSQLESIQQAKAALRAELESVGAVEPKSKNSNTATMTQEELDMEAERDEMRMMLFGIAKTEEQPEFAVPVAWTNQNATTTAKTSGDRVVGSLAEEKVASVDMWLPTPQLTFESEPIGPMGGVDVSQTLTESMTLDFSETESDNDVMPVSTNHQPRPVSRASVITDADIDSETRRQLAQIEAQFLAEQEHDEY